MGCKALFSEDVKPALQWLQETFEEEAEDLEEDNEDSEGVPLLAISEPCITALENNKFQKLLLILQIIQPQAGEQYWKIPSCVTSDALKAKASLIERILQEHEDLTSNLNMSCLFGPSTSRNDQSVATTLSSHKSKPKTKKKKVKRGPN